MRGRSGVLLQCVFFWGGIAQAAIGDGLVAYYKEDSSTGHPERAGGPAATVVGNTPFFTTEGKIGGAYNFTGNRTGADSRVRAVLPVSTLSLGGSISVWVKNFSSGLRDNATIAQIQESQSGAFGHIMLYINPALSARAGKFSFYAGSGQATDTNAVSTTSVVDGTWYHLVGTWDKVANVARIYVNGNLEGSVSVPTWGQTTDNFFWGAGFNGFGTNGTIDEVGLWGRPLSAAEVSGLYNNGAGTTFPTVVPPTITSVTSATDFGGATQFTSGSWLEIKGTGLAATTRTWAESDFRGVNAPTILDGTSVSINGRSAFVYYVSPTQLNVQAPADTVTGPVQVVVNSPNGTAAFSRNRAAVAPGLLAPASFNVGGRQYLVAQFPDGAFVGRTGLIPGAAFRPAKPGDVLTVYGVGFGDVAPAIPPGVIVERQNTILGTPSFRFGSVPATLNYRGLSPGYLGLYQFNIVVPNVADGDVQITVVHGVTLPQVVYLTIQASSSPSVVAYSNLGTTTTFNPNAYFPGIRTFSFVATESARLTNIQLPLRRFTEAENLVVKLYQDGTAGTPGAEMFSQAFNPAITTSNSTIVDFAVNGPTLARGRTYWIELRLGDFGWPVNSTGARGSLAFFSNGVWAVTSTTAELGAFQLVGEPVP